MKEEIILLEAGNLISQIEKEKRPANELINSFTRTHKSFGSKDRKKLTEIVWNYVRHKMRLDYLYPDAPISKRIEILSDKTWLKNKELPFHVQMETPEWLIEKIKNAIEPTRKSNFDVFVHKVLKHKWRKTRTKINKLSMQMKTTKIFSNLIKKQHILILQS